MRRLVRSTQLSATLLCLGAMLLVAAAPPVHAREYEGTPLRTVAHFSIVEDGGLTRFVPTQPNAAGDVYYANITNPTGAVITQGPAALVGANGMTRLLADDILGVIANNSVIELTFSVANTNAVTVTARPRFRFWQANGAGGGPGTYLGTVGLTFPSTPFPPGVTVTVGGIPAGVFPMPGTKFWVGMVLDNENGTTGATLAQLGALGQAVFDPPTLGSSPDIPFITNSAGSFLGTNNPAGSRVSQTGGPRISTGWKFTDTPCPTITASAGPDGSISPSGTVRVDCGGSQTFTITPNACYDIADVLVDGASVGAVSSYTFTNVTAPRTISATFRFHDARANDADGDGLEDEWETLGIPFADGSGRYVLPGADPQHKDLYIEADAMQNNVPPLAALTDVVGAFARAPVCNPDHTSGVRLHLVGEGCDPCLDETNVLEDDWTAWSPATDATVWSEIHAVKGARFGTLAERGGPNPAQLLSAKARGFRWAIFAKSIGGYSGIADSSDIAVTQDARFFHAITRDMWAGTLMHELGHSLGLGHGGAPNGVWDDRNFKPNYFSVMNYLWQWPVPPLNPALADPLRAYRSSWELDYSKSKMSPLVEGDLDETAGFGGSSAKRVPIGPPRSAAFGLIKWFDMVAMGGPIDLDYDGHSSRMHVQRDLDYFEVKGQSPGVSAEVMQPSDDWSVLRYAPRESFPPPPPGPAPRIATAISIEPEMTQDIYDSLASLHFDCNRNDIEDAEEIAAGTIPDLDANGIPDECEGLALVLPVPDRAPSGADGLSVLPRAGAHEVRFACRTRERLQLAIHDLGGRRVATLFEGVEEPGEHVRLWSHRDDGGRAVRPGVYFVVLRSESRQLTRRAIVLQ